MGTITYILSMRKMRPTLVSWPLGGPAVLSCWSERTSQVLLPLSPSAGEGLHTGAVTSLLRLLHNEEAYRRFKNEAVALPSGASRLLIKQ